MNPELLMSLRSLSRATYLVTEEEDQAILAIHDLFVKAREAKKNSPKAFVYIYPFGLIPIGALIENWKSRAIPDVGPQSQPLRAFETIYRNDPQGEQHFYIITDPERWMAESALVRYMLNIIHQVRSEPRIVKCLVFVGSKLVVHPKLQSYVHVVRDPVMSDDGIRSVLETCSQGLKKPFEFNESIIPWFRGLTAYQIETALTRSIVGTRNDVNNPKRIDKGHVQEYKNNVIKSTDLLTQVDVSECTFDRIGGLDRFKAWVETSIPAWTSEGKKYGLKPPKGVLATGVWGCGKSLSIKAMANRWKLPCIQLELGKLRARGLGDTESNVYRVIALIEAMAPCVVYVDEAEKSFSGSGSSNFTDGGATDRMLAILSNWHQETKAEVCLAMTSNSLRTLPVEFTNRVEDRYFFDLPDTDTRVDILKIALRNETTLTPDEIGEFPLRKLAEAAEDLVPREIEQALRGALRRSFVADKPNMDPDILGHELSTKSRILRTMDKELREVLDWVGWDPKAEDGIRARFASSKQSSNTLKILSGGIK